LELNKKTMQRIMLLITFAVLLFWGLYNISAVTKVLGKLLDLLSPLLLGICIAFVLNLMMAALERLWDRALAKWDSRWNRKLKRPVCLALTMVLFIGIIFAIFFILLPRLEEAGSTLVANIPTYVAQIQAWWGNLSAFGAEHGVTLPELVDASYAKTLIMLVIPVIMIILMLKGWNLIGTLIVCDLVGFVLCLVFGFIEPAKMVDAAGPIGAGLTGMLNVICFSFFMFALLEMLTRIAAIAGVEGALELEVTINEQIRAVRPIKLEDRLRHMNEKNPLLAELRRELDLEVE